MSLPKLNLISGFGGKGVLDRQHFFTSGPTAKMHLKSLVGVLLGESPLGALPPSLAPVSMFLFRLIVLCEYIFSTSVNAIDWVKIIKPTVFPLPGPQVRCPICVL